MIDASQPETPGWWLQRLIKRLSESQRHYTDLEAYYDGTNSVPVAASKVVSEAYKRLMRVSNTNYAELVVEAVRERMQPIRIRTGAAGDRLGDDEAWRIWQANSLDADASLVHSSSLSMGLGFVIVGPTDPEIEAPLITPEDPREVIVEVDPRRRRKVVAALKCYRDDITNTHVAYLYLQDEVWRAEAHTTEGTQITAIESWEWTGAIHLPGPPPVVPFPNRPKLGQMVTRGEFETHISILDRINYTILQRVEIATLQAFRQRALKGGPQRDPNTGEEIDYDDIFDADPGSIWHLPETADIWESGQVNLEPISAAVKADVQALAAVTRTPLYYLTSDSANGSAEGASLAREGLIFKTTDRIRQAQEAWEDVMSLAFRFAGDEVRAKRSAMEVDFANPERMSLAQMADGGNKALTGGLNVRKVRERVWGFTPQEIEEMEEEDRKQALREQGAALAGAVIREAGTDSQPPTG